VADDLASVAGALRAHRDLPDGHLLDRVLHRVRSASRPPKRRRLLSLRTAVIAILALAVVAGARLSHLDPMQTVATLAGSVSNPVSGSPSGQTANYVLLPRRPGWLGADLPLALWAAHSGYGRLR
jgi:hypothetical protein